MIRSARHILRLWQIALTLARYDALFLLERWQIAPGVTFAVRLFSGGYRRIGRMSWRRVRGATTRRPARERARSRPTGQPARPLPPVADHKPLAGRPGQRLSRALEELGPTFIKLGQALSTRSDLVGEDVAADLSGLQDRLPPFPAAAARATIESEFERPLSELYAHFEEEPVAAASIAQVHFAVTPDGEEVAVKILRPGIENAVARDIDLFLWVAQIVERTQPSLRRLRPTDAVRTFAESVALEMDLRFEAAAASEMAENFVGDPTFRIPRVVWQRTGRRVLTVERISGVPIDERESLIAAGHDPTDILAKAAGAFFNQVFRDGFFHADLHPGNLFVAADGSIAAVDFGITGRLDRKTRYYLADMLIGFLTGDYRRVAEVHFSAGYVPANKSIEAFTQACRSIGEPILGLPLHEISVARLLAQLFEVTETFEMETQPQLLLLQKTMLLAEGVGRTLNPDVNMWQLARPLIEDWMRENRGPEARIRDGAAEVVASLERLPALVSDLEQAAAAVANGGVRLHPDTIRALHALRRSSHLPTGLWLAVVLLVIAIALII